MKKSNEQKLRLGIFVIICTMLLISVLYFIGNKQNIFGKTFKISAVFNNVNGLILGNNVRYSGMNVGTVKKINMINDTTICVDMIVENEYLKHIKKNAIAAIGSDGLVGSMVINIVPKKGNALALFPGDTIMSYSRISTNDMLSTLNTTNENAALLTSDLLKITKLINEGKGTLGMLIKDEDMALNLKNTILYLNKTSISASNAMGDIQKMVAAVNYDESVAGVLLSDSISAVKFKSIITNLEKSSEEIDAMISNINDVVISVKNNEGMVNYILNDTMLVKTIDSTTKNLKKGSLLLNENLEALKHNFLTRRYFKKLEKQKGKEEKLKKN